MTAVRENKYPILQDVLTTLRPIGLRFMELCDYLEECLGREVDLLTLTGVQHIRNPDISRSILGSLVYV